MIRQYGAVRSSLQGKPRASGDDPPPSEDLHGYST